MQIKKKNSKKLKKKKKEFRYAKWLKSVENRKENNRTKPESVDTFHHTYKIFNQSIWFDIIQHDITGYGMIEYGRREKNKIND